MKPGNKIQVFDTADVLSEAVANLIIEVANGAIAKHGRFTIVLSGGSTPEKLYALLATPVFQSKIDWNRTYIFWGDERCVSANDDKNNAHRARILLLDKIDIPNDNIFPIPVELPPSEAAAIYERTIRFFFGGKPASFDLVLLGLGEDGHTASLFPGTDVLAEQTKWVTKVYIKEQDMFRITLTPLLFNQAERIVFIIAGTRKAGIVKELLQSSSSSIQYPAQLIKPKNGNLLWMLDKAAASIP